MHKQQLKAALIGAALTLAVGTAAVAPAMAQQTTGPDNAWLQGMMKGMEMMGGKMKASSMADMKGMTMSKPGLVIIDMKTGRMMAIDAAEAARYFPVVP
jgi:hypothetical protein